MTNTSFIGGVNRFSNNDKITPFVSYKVVSMLSPDEHGDVKLYGPHHPNIHYGFSDEALCKTKKPCTHFEDCSCGFYGYNLVEDALDHWRIQCDGKYDSAAVLVQVAFSGKVTVCEKGYRSSHQRIKKILLNSCCLCSNTSEMIAPHENGNMVPLCRKCFIETPVKQKKGFFNKKQETSDRPAVKALTFEDFSMRYSPTGFNNIQIGSVADFSDKDKIRDFFGTRKLFTFLPGDKSDIPLNFSDYLSTLDQKDMDKILALVSGEMGRRITSSGEFPQH